MKKITVFTMLLVFIVITQTWAAPVATQNFSDIITKGPWVDARSFGADPSKSSSVNTVAIQKAINFAASNGKQLKFPFKNKVYFINAKITIPSNADIDFNDCSLKRDIAAGVFDMLENSDPVAGNTNIKVLNLVIDGNKDADGRNAINVADRFRGIGLFKVTKSVFRNLTVTGTVNGEIQAEGNRAGVYLEGCSHVDFYDFEGYGNDRTAFMPYQSDYIKIDGAKVYNNLGSGISSNYSDYNNWSNIYAHDNGYSQVSMNGIKGKLTNIFSWNGGAAFAGVNIGHNSAGAHAHETVATNIHVWNNAGWGLNIGGSNDVIVNGVYAYGNTDRNIRVFDDSSRSIISGVISAWGQSTGIIYYSGTGHLLNNALVYKNGVGGIHIEPGVGLTLGTNIRSYDNGQVNTSNSSAFTTNGGAAIVNGGEYFNSTGTVTAITKANPASVTAPSHGRTTGEKVKLTATGMTEVNGNIYTITVVDSNTYTLNGVNSTAFGTFVSGSWASPQEAGIWAAGGTISLRRPFINGNTTYSIRETSSPVFIERSGVRLSSDAMSGSFTAAANTSTTVTNANVASASRIVIRPQNAAAVTKGTPYVSSIVAGTSFTITFPTAAAGTEQYYYEII